MTDLLVPAYLAGIIDGEGSVYSRRRNPHVSVGYTSRRLIDALVELGGYVHERKPNRGLGTKVGWDWVVCGETAAILLRACRPFMLVKGERADEVLAAWASVTGSNHDHFADAARRRMAEIGWS